jgi:hypothetical protein
MKKPNVVTGEYIYIYKIKIKINKKHYPSLPGRFIKIFKHVLSAKMGLSRTMDDVVSMSLNHLNSSFVEMINEDSLLPRSAKVSSGTGFEAVEVGFDEIGVGDE